MLIRMKFEFTDLIESILDHLPEKLFKSKTTTFLDPNMGGGQFVKSIEDRLRRYGHSDENIADRVFGFESNQMRINYVVNKHGLVGNYSALKTMKFLECEEFGMKFDCVVGNPPFSSHAEGKTAGKRGRELYIDFFKKSVEMADYVAMVMPTTNKKVQEKHNNLLKEKANVIEFIPDDVFDVTMPMWYVVVNGTDQKPNVSFDITNVVGNTIKWTKGKVNMTHYKELTGGHGEDNKAKSNDITIYHKLNNKGLVTKFGKRANFKDHEFFPNTGYAVLMPQTITDDGWSRTKIVKCSGDQVAFNGMSIVFTNTKAQAQKLIDVMSTKSFKDQANNVKQGFNNMNMSCLTAIKIDKKVENDIFG
jgi:hypothetical protein